MAGARILRPRGHVRTDLNRYNTYSRDCGFPPIVKHTRLWKRESPHQSVNIDCRPAIRSIPVVPASLYYCKVCIESPPFANSRSSSQDTFPHRSWFLRLIQKRSVNLWKTKKKAFCVLLQAQTDPLKSEVSINYTSSRASCSC